MIKFLLKLCGYKHIRIYLKSGNNFLVICKNATWKYYTETGFLNYYKFENLFGSFPHYICIPDIEAIIEEK